MELVLDPAFLPATLTAPPMTDEEFAAFCAEHPDMFFEMTADGELIVMPPTYSWTAVQNNDIGSQLRVWAKRDGRGKVSDSSGGFVLPNGARRSPDAAWTLKSRIKDLPPESKATFWHLCPDFVIELRSVSDRLKPLHQKMNEYLENGAQLGWLIDPAARAVSIYRPHREVEILTNLDSVIGEAPVGGFELDLTSVWNPED